MHSNFVDQGQPLIALLNLTEIRSLRPGIGFKDPEDNIFC